MGKQDDFYPDWTTRAPEQGTYRSIFKWGAPDRFKHPNAGFYGLLKDELGLTDADFQEKRNQGNNRVQCDIPISLRTDQVQRFKQIVGEDNIAMDDYSRVKY